MVQDQLSLLSQTLRDQHVISEGGAGDKGRARKRLRKVDVSKNFYKSSFMCFDFGYWCFFFRRWRMDMNDMNAMN